MYATTGGVDPQLGDARPVLVAEPVRLGLEVRAFVRERVVRALSVFVRGGQLAKMSDGTWPMAQGEEAACAPLGRLLADPGVELPPAVVIDVGAIEGRGWAVLEANPPGTPGCAMPIRPRCSRCCAAAWCRTGRARRGGGCGRART